MEFDKITENETLWAVRYDNCLDNDICDMDSFKDYITEVY